MALWPVFKKRIDKKKNGGHDKFVTSFFFIAITN